MKKKEERMKQKHKQAPYLTYNQIIEWKKKRKKKKMKTDAAIYYYNIFTYNRIFTIVPEYQFGWVSSQRLREALKKIIVVKKVNKYKLT